MAYEPLRKSVQRPRYETNAPTPVTWIVAAGFIAIFLMIGWPILHRLWELAK